MISDPAKTLRLGFRASFAQPNLVLVPALESAIATLASADLETNHYKLDRGHGSRREQRKMGRLYAKNELLDELVRDTFNEVGPSFVAHALHADHEQIIHVSPPCPNNPFQRFGMSGVAGLKAKHFHKLVQNISKLAKLAFAGANEGNYLAWQGCDDPYWYCERYGPITGFRVIHSQRPAPLPTIDKLDVSKNPGRISSVNAMPVFIAADIWLGPAFWKYAPCTKEEVLKEPWVELEDTEHYLYLKAYPEPFTRPDGEQGRIQRRLWNVLFHQDCEWPPGSGGISDVAVGGPSEFMPSIEPK